MPDDQPDVGQGQTRFLDSLTEILGAERTGKIFQCIEDLVVNGLQPSRLGANEPVPNRQDVTQYLGAWCRFAGLEAEVCRPWLTDYAVGMLSAISKSSAAAIRHSTKSNLRYIYRSQVAFFCGREKNPFRARCSRECPVYAQMADQPDRPQAQVAFPAYDDFPGVTRVEPVRPVKEVHREQFEAGMQLVEQELRKGTKITKILPLLKERGLLSRTGRAWNYAGLHREIQRLKAPRQAAPPDSGHPTSE